MAKARPVQPGPEMVVAPRKCEKCDEPAMADRNICKDHFAEYMQEYRQRADRKRDRANASRGYEEGVKAALVFLRTRVGTRSVTGLRAAVEIERACLAQDGYALMERRKLIESIRPWH